MKGKAWLIILLLAVMTFFFLLKIQLLEDKNSSMKYYLMTENSGLKERISILEDDKQSLLSKETIYQNEKVLTDNKLEVYKESLAQANKVKTTPNGQTKFYREPWYMTPDECEDHIGDLSDLILEMLHSGDYAGIAPYIHPRAGLRLSPFAYISLEMNLVLNQKEYLESLDNQTSFLWGYTEGSEKEINLTLKDYMKNYVYSRNYKEESIVSYIKPIEAVFYFGNLYDLYHDPAVVTYYHTDPESEYAVYDWRALTLVFEDYEDKWYLINVINNQWTP